MSLGDPVGIGPEIILKALFSSQDLPKAHYILFGSSAAIQREREALDLSLKIEPFQEISDLSETRISLIEVNSFPTSLKPGLLQKESGFLSFRYFEETVKQVRDGRIHALVTAPISKQAWSLAGIHWSGHTEYLSQMYPKVIMCFWSDKLKVALFSHHLSLRKAIERIERNSLFHFFLRLYDSLSAQPSDHFRFLVAGLNPHAGEQGLIGSEENDEIAPAVKDAQAKGMDIQGPFPPDVVFRMARNQEQTIVIALYHDQGLIPFKLESFEEGVNVSLGLPFVRTSPDHGTAFDIAGKGMANPKSMIEAIKLAHKLSSFVSL
ncbi:4-hydroxythreonine-4-phosphate dehydrogenase PdxA [Acidobacteriota bacterium]